MITYETILSNPRAVIGLVGAAILLLVMFVWDKKENKKVFRHKQEYGSARWGTKKDIEPFGDPNFRNNIILSKTEMLTLDGQPKLPKYARNKNVLVVGGSGSGKTRFFIKP
ncbi:MAG: type IV secretory system conjugative DNA transfer family protein, partial [Bacteroidaceae bacterium]|nr:type IV secretory system conjugative DNA transfer family protein [Bacteroidaceae bacterium]